jgi:hypothetical protein
MRGRTTHVARHAHRLTKGAARHHHTALAAHGASDGPLSGLAHLAGVLWLPVVLLAAVVSVAWLAGRMWGRRRLSRSGCWFEVRLGEEVSRAGLEAFLRTLAHGLPRPLLGGVPWVGLSVSAVEDRAACWLFVSGGLAASQVRAALEQALGGVTVDAPGAPVLWLVAGRVGLRACGLWSRGSCRCGWISGWTRRASCWRRCVRRRAGRAVRSSSCCRLLQARRGLARGGRRPGCAPGRVWGRAALHGWWARSASSRAGCWTC